ncbi:MAG: ubiquitin-like domain-containing protein [Candidatus Nomurabacteria bacterium]|jgi:uncharacterized protein YabE (DUF348 family)|nr:ubiquitin-like domain-containing protein [Candidatus Nomurabacteria bacterium]
MHVFNLVKSVVGRLPKWTAYLAVLILIAGVLGIFSFKNNSVSADSQAVLTKPSQRLITIYDGGQSRTLITTASTVGGALTQAKISVEKVDSVEPALDTPLLASSYSINIYRARPVTVVDGGQKIRVLTAAKSPAGIAAAAGLKLYSEDSTNLAQTDDVLADGGAGLTLTITRATPLTLTLYGQVNQIRTQAKTVGELLNDRKIKLGKNDTLSQAKSAPITAGMTVEIWRNGQQTVTNLEPIPFGTQTINDPNQPVGYSKIQTAGVNGSKSVTYVIEMKNGQEVGRQQIQSVVITQPTDEVKIVGTRSQLPAGSHEDWMRAAGISSGDYGYVNYIFSRESGWRPNAVSSNGYYGLGQTRQSALVDACGDTYATDPICQIRYFNGYATGRYGSWSGAQSFWQSHHWW